MTNAKTIQDSHQFRGDLAYLHEESLLTIAVIAGVVGYIWLWADIWPVTGNNAPPASWVGGILLTLGSLVSYYFRRKHLRLTSHFLVWCIIGAVSCALIASSNNTFSYLFILPIMFAGEVL